MEKIKINLKKLFLFDYILIFIFIACVFLFAKTFYRKADFVEVTVKVSETDVTFSPWSVETAVSDWFSGLFFVGMTEKDTLGNVQAEVLNVYSYDTRPARKVVYLKLKLRGVYTSATGRYSYNGKPILIGNTIKLQLDDLNVEGLLTDISGSRDEKKQKIFITAVIKNEDQTYYETEGVEPYIADGIRVGDEVRDSNGNLILTIKSKRVENAEKLVVTGDGRAFIRNNPLRKFVTLEIVAWAYGINDKYYIFDDVPVLIGEVIPINTKELSIYPRVADFQVDEKS